MHVVTKDPVRERRMTNGEAHRGKLSDDKKGVLASRETPTQRVTYHRVHIGLRPDDVMVMVDDHWSAEHVEVLHDVLLHISQG